MVVCFVFADHSNKKLPVNDEIIFKELVGEYKKYNPSISDYALPCPQSGMCSVFLPGLCTNC